MWILVFKIVLEFQISRNSTKMEYWAFVSNLLKHSLCMYIGDDFDDFEPLNIVQGLTLQIQT